MADGYNKTAQSLNQSSTHSIPSAFVLFFCLVLLILLPTISLEPTVVPTLAPQPTLQPIANYVPGLSEIPPGKYLFVEYWSIYDGIGHCGLMAVDFPSYFYIKDPNDGHFLSYDEDSIELGGEYVPLNQWTLNSIRGFYGTGMSVGPGMGSGASSKLSAIATFPYRGRYPQILSVYARGAIVVKMKDDKTYLVEPGQVWATRQESEATPEPRCLPYITYEFTNYGLLDRSQIRLR